LQAEGIAETGINDAGYNLRESGDRVGDSDSEIYLCRCASRKDPWFKLPVLSDRQDDLAGVLALFQIGLRLAGLRERKALVHMGADPAIRDALQ
jgi:hypothetical protein